jgi:hypothetical protein
MKKLLDALRAILNGARRLLATAHQADLAITGNGVGFYSIQGVTPAGQEWVCSLVDGADSQGLAYSDTSNFARAIADGALADGLTVTVNGKAYEVTA